MEKVILEKIQEWNSQTKKQILEILNDYHHDVPIPKSIVVDEVMQTILTYCNLDEFPRELIFVAVKMVVAMMTSGEEQKEAKAISVGDTRVELTPTDITLRIQEVLCDFKAQLQQFRKLKW